MRSGRRRRVAWATGAIAGLLAVTAALPGAATALPPTTWSDGVPATFAPGVQSTSPGDTFNAVSCAAPGECVAAGSFKDADGDQQAFTQTSTGGVWAPGVPADFAGGVQRAAELAQFTAVSCAAPGSCVAVGDFRDPDGDTRAFTATMTGGAWAQAEVVTFSGGVERPSAYTRLWAVSCGAPGSCTAVGSVVDAESDIQAFTVTMTDGTWAPPVLATFAAGVQRPAQRTWLYGVSCTAPGECTAAGVVTDVNSDEQAFTQRSIAGTWGEGQLVTFAAGVQSVTPSSNFFGVSCTAPGECTAAGNFRDVDGDELAFTQRSVGGVWADGEPLPFAPGTLNSPPFSHGAGVSCGSADQCTVVGYFTDVNSDTQAFTASSIGGVWSDAVPVAFAAGIQFSGPYSEAYDVSCASPGNCTAVGYFTDVDGQYRGFTVDQTAGSWGQAVVVAFAPGVESPYPYTYPNAVSCAAAGNCTAAGTVLGGDNTNYLAFTVTSTTPAPSVSAVSPGSGPADGGTTVTVTGSGFADGLTTVTVGGVPCASVSVASATSLTCVTGARASGVVDVVVTVNTLASTDGIGRFTYTDGPTSPEVRFVG